MDLMPGFDSLPNIHPLFVHFPIALILVTLLFEAIWWVTRRNEFRTTATYLLYLSALSAVVTVTSGWIAMGQFGGSGHDYVHLHGNIMTWMSGLLMLTAIAALAIRPLREGNARKFLIVPLLVISALLVYGADKGGMLVFKFGIGVEARSTPTETNHTNEHQH